MNYTREIVRIIQQTHNIAIFMSFFALFSITLSSTHFLCNQKNVSYIIYVLNRHYRISQIYTK